MANEQFTVACAPCTRNTGRTTIALETGRFTTTGQEPPAPDGTPIPRGILGIRLLCPTCKAQPFFYPTVVHYTCDNCGHKKETYVAGGANAPAKGAGISYKETIGGQNDGQKFLDEMRAGGAIGGWGSV